MFLEVVAVIGVIAANVICYAFHDKSLIRYKWGGPKLLLISNRLPLVPSAKIYPGDQASSLRDSYEDGLVHLSLQTMDSELM